MVNLVVRLMVRLVARHIIRKVFMVSLLSLLAACTFTVQPPPVPNDLKTSGAERLAFAMRAEGVQIYQCKPNATDASKIEWTFSGPEAVLYDSAHNEIGKHYGGPTWESQDGSKVIGEVKARADAPVTGAIPWLLLNAKSTEGTGVFSAVSSIQRLDTTGGPAPKEGCDQAHLDEVARVPYTANYYFYTAH